MIIYLVYIAEIMEMISIPLRKKQT